jgi:hypothetical protein
MSIYMNGSVARCAVEFCERSHDPNIVRVAKMTLGSLFSHNPHHFMIAGKYQYLGMEYF